MLDIPLTRTEEKLMLFLWEQDRPMSVTEILEAWEEGNWTKNYIRDILRLMEQKGAVKFHSLERRGSKYARRFCTAVSKEEYYTRLAKHSGVTVSKMLQAEAVAMVEKGDREGMEKLIRELEGIIEEYRAGNGEG